jgi:hypothetical protein
LKNKEALKIIADIINDITDNGIDSENIIKKLKDLRGYAVEEKRPVVAKALRLAYEHLEENDGFIIPIPTDEPLENEDDVELITGDESFIYFMNLIKKSGNKLNLLEIREYNKYMEL